MRVLLNLLSLIHGENTMKRTKLFLCVLCMFFSQYGFAQVRHSAEIMPQFEGSTNGLKQWLAENMKYPEEAILNKEEGRVTVNFVVKEDGSIAQPKIANSVSRSLDAEALRLVATMPKWIPASQDGQPCAVEYSLPIKFNLPTIQKSQAIDTEKGNVNNNPNLKWYKGEYTWVLIPNAIVAYARLKGKAQYQYLDNTGGGRIFEGVFLFSASDGQNAYVFKGNMKENHQIGEWNYQWGGMDRNEDPIVLNSHITFDENGHPIGKFEVYDLRGYDFYKGTIQSGIIVDDFYYHDPKFKIWGKYNQSGKAIGEWKCSAKVRGEWYSAKCIYSDNGSLLKNWFYTKYDNRTGDTTEHQLYIDADYYTPHGLQHYTIQKIQGLMFRDSSF